MILKILLVLGVIAAVYFLFIKKPAVTKSSKGGPGKPENDDTVACHKCGTYVTLDDAIVSNGHYYCSNECLKG
jgi:uncharacterized protein